LYLRLIRELADTILVGRGCQPLSFPPVTIPGATQFLTTPFPGTIPAAPFPFLYHSPPAATARPTPKQSRTNIRIYVSIIPKIRYAVRTGYFQSFF
jgi:hypothetical protein